MKIVSIVFAGLLVFASCSSDKTTKKDVVANDSSVFLKDNTALDTAGVSALPVAAAPVPLANTRSTDSSANRRTVSTRKTESKSKTKAGTASAPSRKTAVSSQTNTASASTPTKTAKKKKWSNRAKGAVIGGASGAVVGAVVSKKKLKGGIIGGVTGAAGGYIIGNEIDRKKKNP